MPSVKNPNGPSQNRQAAMRASAKKKAQKSSAAGQSRISKSDARRGAREGILPTSGPNRALSAKKQRKVDKARAHALKRKMEAEGEVEMKGMCPSRQLQLQAPLRRIWKNKTALLTLILCADAAETTATKEGKEEMDMDAENIS